jgi:hypothetical protein
MKVSIELSEENIRAILADWLNSNYKLNLRGDQLHIEVKSKQNYRSEWEVADIRLKQEIVLFSEVGKDD